MKSRILLSRVLNSSAPARRFRSAAWSLVSALRSQYRRAESLYYRAFYSAPKVFSVSIEGVGHYKIKLRLADGRSKVRRAKGSYEKEVKAIFHRMVKPGFTVLDIGAHVGGFTIEAALLCGPTGHVHAIEMIPSFFEALLDNIALNHLENVTAHLLGLSNVKGALIVQDGYGYSESPVVGGLSSSSEKAAEVRIVTLDDFCASIDSVDVIKMDVEGAEQRILAGAVQTFGRMSNMTVICEVHPHLLPQGIDDVVFIYDFLHSFGYTISIIDEPYRGHPHILAAKASTYSSKGLIPSTCPDDLIMWSRL